jgi:hypothetical protein
MNLQAGVGVAASISHRCHGLAKQCQDERSTRTPHVMQIHV